MNREDFTMAGCSDHIGDIVDSGADPNKKVLVGIPMTGTLRAEWVMARYGQMMPSNWAYSQFVAWLDQYTPLRYTVADARNMCVKRAVEDGYEWLFFIDHDVILPHGTLIKMNEYMQKPEYPIVSGLYFTRAVPSEPLIYRGNGTGYYRDWSAGDKVMVSGCGLGCAIVSVDLLRSVYNEAQEYKTHRGDVVRRVFRTPSSEGFDRDRLIHLAMMGTEDLDFFNRLKIDGVYAKTKWKEFQDKEFPILMDTSIFCKHIDPNGIQYPAQGEERAFMPTK